MTPETVLLRQVHPSFYPERQLSSQAFFPFLKDDGLLSVYDGDQIGAAQAYVHYTEHLGFESVGVWGVTSSEATGARLTARVDPLPDFASHAVIDFTGCSEKDYRKLAKKLKALAIVRGCLHEAVI